MRASRALDRVREALPRPRVRAGAPYLGSWRLLGPFGAGEDPGAEGVRALPPTAWRDFDERTVNRAYDDYNDLWLWLRREAGVAPAEGSVSYLSTWANAATPGTAELRLGATGPVTAWWDEQRVLEGTGWSLRRDARRAGLSLAAGWHRLLLRTEHAGGPWGLYVRLTDSRGGPVRGLTPALGGPGELEVATWALPAAFVSWPYVELANARPEPRASPFVLTAAGGRPPYRWAITNASAPAWLALDPATGALKGTPTEPGEHELAVRVTDAAGAQADRRLSLRVAEPPTRWHEDGSLGVFVHFDKPASVPVESWDAGLAAHPGFAERWASLAQAAGASVLVLTARHHDSWANWPTDVRRSDGVPAQRTGTDTLTPVRQAVTERGMRFGVYVSTLDTWHPGYRDDRPDYLRFLFDQVAEVVERCEPAMVWLDGHWDAPRSDWAYDPLFSLIHGLVPEAVIANNPGRRTLNIGDAGYGDVDVRTFEGHSPWEHMPRPQRRRRNPRPLPGQKLSFVCNWWAPGPEPGWLGCERNACWEEWARVLSRVVCDGGSLLLGVGPGYPGAPPGAPPPGALYEQAEDVLLGLGHWLWPDRAEAFAGVRPGPLKPARWGRTVTRDHTVYLHLPPGRGRGWRRPRLRVGPLPPVRGARLLPGGEPVPFAQRGDRVTLELAGLEADPVLGLVALDVRRQPAAAA